MNRARSQAGFSLIEVMCALLVLGVGIVGLTQAVVTALRSGKEAETLTAAVLAAAGRLETLRAEGWLVEGEETGACEAPLESCRWRQVVQPTSTRGLYDVQVVIERRDTGKPVYTLETLLFQAPQETGATGRERRPDRRRSERSRGGGR